MNPSSFLQDKLRHLWLVKMHCDLSNVSLDLQSLMHMVEYCHLPWLKPLTDLQIRKKMHISSAARLIIQNNSVYHIAMSYSSMYDWNVLCVSHAVATRYLIVTRCPWVKMDTRGRKRLLTSRRSTTSRRCWGRKCCHCSRALINVRTL